MSGSRYDHRKIEAKWQARWDEERPFFSDVESGKEKYYVLDMFPYPSGAGLHVGHVAGYTATDIVARHKRQLGLNVLHPMGWDSFGLPAEQYAVRTGTHPSVTTEKNTDNYRRQLKSLGFSYDWDREIMTSSPDYYKWTQWIFTKLYERGLAFEAEALVNYCPALQTILANEEVEDGKSVEGGHPVERRPLRQWVLKITAYAERLLEDLDDLDWPEGLKKLQRNWIGRSEGAQIAFREEKSNEPISVFTTCPHTLFGATFMVLSPEHPLVAKFTTDEKRAEVEAYQAKTAAKSDMERTDLAKDKTGVFLGAYAINPINGGKVPIWISDYVLMGYGTGAIMCVPAHDERDFEFAKKFGLEIKPVIDPGTEESAAIHAGDICWPGDGVMVNSEFMNGQAVPVAKESSIEWLEEKTLGERTITYKLRDWLFSRQRYWGEPFPILHFEDGTTRSLGPDELPLVPPELDDYRPSADGRSPLARATDWVEITDPVTGKPARRETHTMPQWAGSCWYYLRFCDPKNAGEAWSKACDQYWMPVDLYVGGAEHAVLHLLYARFWHKVLYDCGLTHTPEPFPRLRNPGMVTAPSYARLSGGYVSPEDVEKRDGKFFEKESGAELRTQVEKMSKSKFNGVSPDDVVEELGADSLRMYEMFMGPLDKEKVWNTDAVTGCHRFLNRFYDLVTSDKVTDQPSEVANRLGHKLAWGVREDIKKLQFNTAIAKMMEFINAFSKLEGYPRDVLCMVTQALMPFAPHMAEEAWELLGRKEVLTTHPYPEVDERYLQEDQITYVIQVNGKLRSRLELPKDAEQERVVELAKESPQVAKYLNGTEVRKVIFVPNKLVNFVL